MAEVPHYDLAILGSGPGGYVASIRSAQLGMKTAIIEAENHFGGTCLHWGCIPTKSLLFNAEVLGYFQNGREYGAPLRPLALDWDAVQQRKNKIVRKLSQGIEFLLKKNKVDVIQGYGRLAGNGRIKISGPKAKHGLIESRNIVLATGSEAKQVPGLDPDKNSILTNKEILGRERVPESLVVMGAGAVGVEFASIFRRLGTRVTLIEMLPRVLPNEDEEVSAEIERCLSKQGIAIHTQAVVQSAAKAGRGARIVFTSSSGEVHRCDAEALLVAIGRTPNTGDIGLENTRIKPDRGFIPVDEHMQTQEPGTSAIGDIVAESPLLAHVGEMEGIVAVTYAAGQPAEPINYRQVPNCIYSEPEVASVGLTQEQALEEGYKIRIGKVPFSANSKAAILGARDGFVKIVSEEQYGEILGVHMIGPRVTEMIAEAVVAMRLEATVEDLAHAIHPHPTLTEALMEAAHAAHDRAIHA